MSRLAVVHDALSACPDPSIADLVEHLRARPEVRARVLDAFAEPEAVPAWLAAPDVYAVWAALTCSTPTGLAEAGAAVTRALEWTTLAVGLCGAAGLPGERRRWIDVERALVMAQGALLLVVVGEAQP